MRWQDVSPELYHRVRESTSTQVLSTGLYPVGFEKITNLKSVYVWQTTGPTKIVSDGTTVTNVVGGLDLFRGGAKAGDPKFKSDRYLFAESTKGQVSMLGPFKDVPHGHHLEELPGWATAQSSSHTS